MNVQRPAQQTRAANSLPIGSSSPSAARRRDFDDGGRLRARLSWYPPGLHMDAHAHDRHQLSILLSGALGEGIGGREVCIDLPAISIKPAGLRHCNHYGPSGALILSVELVAAVALDRVPGLQERRGWCPRPSSRALATCRRLLADPPVEVDEALQDRLWELVGVMGCSEDPPRGAPPAWVRRCRERLLDEATPSGQLAAEEGLHPVYFSRALLRWTGWQPSALRAGGRIRRALAAVSRGSSLADAAQYAGFSDQAHFSRSARALIGMNPRQLQILLR
jgi:AraC family transcriptional regulator